MLKAAHNNLPSLPEFLEIERKKKKTIYDNEKIYFAVPKNISDVEVILCVWYQRQFYCSESYKYNKYYKQLIIATTI